jgi:arginine/lysine/ornithine decarboxylase
MASLEAAVEQGECYDLWRDLLEEAQALRDALEDTYRILGDKDVGTYGISALDGSKILVNTRPLGVSANGVAEVLRRDYGIEPEFWDEENILFLLGIGSKPSDVRELSRALGDLAGKIARGNLSETFAGGKVFASGSVRCHRIHVPPMRLTPREAWLAPKRSLKLNECLGQIAGETLVTYPPGIPVVIAGEEITEKVMDGLMSNPFLQNLDSLKVAVE